MKITDEIVRPKHFGQMHDRHRSRHSLVGLIMFFLGILIPVATSAEVTLVFGSYAADKPTETVRKYRPFLNFLAEEMSIRLSERVVIRMKIAKKYEDSIAQLANGTVDFARFGPASYVMAKQSNPNVQIVTMESVKGEKRFNGVIVVHKDSEIHFLSELEGQTFAFGDELSTIGRYLAQSHLLDAGISSSDLVGFDYLGRHDLVGEAVGAGRFVAGALKESTFKKLVKKGVPIRALFKFENVTKPWLVSANVSPRVMAAMRDVMLSSENDEIVRKIAKNGFLQGGDEDYDFVRLAMEHSRAF